MGNGIELMLNFRTAVLAKSTGEMNKFGRSTGNVLSMVSMLNSKIGDYKTVVPNMFEDIIRGIGRNQTEFMSKMGITSASLAKMGAEYATEISRDVDAYFSTLDKKYEKLGDYEGILKNIHSQEMKLSSNIQMTESIKNISTALQKLGFDADQSGKMLGNKETGIIGVLGQIQKQAIATGKLKYFDNFNKAFEGMEDTLERATTAQKIKIQKLMLDLDKAAELAVDGNEAAMESFAKLGDQVASQLDRINRKDGGMISTVKEFFNIQEGGFKGIAKGVLGWAGTLESIRQSMAMQDAALESTQRMAIKTGTAFDKLNGELGVTVGSAGRVNAVMQTTMDVASQTGLSVKDAADAMNELSKIRAVDNITDMKELGVVSVQMSQALGVSTSEAAQFIKDLKVIGGLSNREVKLAANSFAEVQASIGLSEAEARSATAQIGKMVRQMRAFGTTKTNISVVSREVAKMTAVFEKVGLSANDANDILDKMMDPDRINDNILLWNGLGMSAQQGIGMMMGEGGNMMGMTDKMVMLAKKLKSQYGNNVFALKQMAEAYGLSLEKVQALSSLTADQIAVQRKENALQEQASKARASLQKSMDRIKNSLMIILEKFLTPVLNIITPILSGLADGTETIFGFIGKMGGGFKTILNILMAIGGGLAFKWFAGGGVKYLKGIVGSFGALKNVMSGIGGTMDSLVRGTKDWIVSLLKGKKIEGEVASMAADVGEGKGGGLLDRIKGKFGKKPKANPVGELDEATKKGGGGMKAFADSLKEIKPAQLLALGGAILMIAAGIALIVISVSQLAKAMKELNPSQIIGLIGVVTVVMGGMVAIIWALVPAITALGAAGSAGAIGLIAIGLAVIMISAGIMMIMNSLVNLMTSLKGLDFKQMAGGIIATSVVMAGMVAMIYALTGAVIALGVAGTAGAVGILAVGAALMMMGAGVALTGLGFKLMAEALSIITPLMGDLAKNIPPIIAPLVTMAAALMSIAGAGAAFAASILLIGSVIPVLLILSIVTAGVANNFYRMGLGISMIAEKAAQAIQGLNAFKDLFSNKNFSNMTADFTKQIESIANSTQKIQGANGGNSKPDTDAVVKEIQKSNELLGKIKDNSDTTNDYLRKMLAKMDKSPLSGGLTFNKP